MWLAAEGYRKMNEMERIQNEIMIERKKDGMRFKHRQCECGGTAFTISKDILPNVDKMVNSPFDNKPFHMKVNYRGESVHTCILCHKEHRSSKYHNTPLLYVNTDNYSQRDTSNIPYIPSEIKIALDLLRNTMKRCNPNSPDYIRLIDLEEINNMAERIITVFNQLDD
jgi:hypothetical protein